MTTTGMKVMLEAWKAFWKGYRRNAPTDTEFKVTADQADAVRHLAAVWAKESGY